MSDTERDLTDPVQDPPDDQGGGTSSALPSDTTDTTSRTQDPPDNQGGGTTT